MWLFSSFYREVQKDVVVVIVPLFMLEFRLVDATYLVVIAIIMVMDIVTGKNAKAQRTVAIIQNVKEDILVATENAAWEG